MSSQPTPVTFPNADRQQLFGILHRPGHRARPDVAILLLSPGVKMRVGPHRLYNKMADRFVAEGYSVLRFDFHGLGDAEGDAPEERLADLYRETQLGRYVPDTIAAMDWMQRTLGFSRFILAGLCGGALTALLAAEHDPRVCGLLALSIPVVLDGSGVDAARYMPIAQLELTRDAYLQRLRFWHAGRSWLRLVTGQSDYRQIVRSIVKPLTGRLRQRQSGGDTAGAPSPTDNTNPFFAPAFLQMVSTSRPILLLFAETDRLYWEFDEKFMARQAPSLARHRAYFDVHVIPRANHIFSFSEWQADVLNLCCAWLGRVEAPIASAG